MTHYGCPILGRAFGALEKEGRGIAAGLYENNDYELGSVRQLAQYYVPVDIVRLRGFATVEILCSILQEAYQRKYWNPERDQALCLIPLHKSWQGLTSTKEILVELRRDLKLDKGEYELKGTKFKDLGVTVMAPHAQVRDYAAYVLPQLELVCDKTILAIETLRPFLRNVDAPIAVLGEILVDVLFAIHGLSVVGPAVTALQLILEARL